MPSISRSSSSPSCKSPSVKNPSGSSPSLGSDPSAGSPSADNASLSSASGSSTSPAPATGAEEGQTWRATQEQREGAVDLAPLLSGPNPWTVTQASAGSLRNRAVLQCDRERFSVDPEAVDRLFLELCDSEALLVGVGSGLSFAAGYDYGGAVFARFFADFIARYHFSDMYRGGFHQFSSPEEHWAYWSRLILLACYHEPPGTTCSKLVRLLAGRDAFVFTTNVDHCLARAGVPEERLFAIQGDFGLWQCSRACHPKTYVNEAQVRRMVAEQRNGRIPSDLVPYCPVCAAPMCMNLRGSHPFVEDEAWEKACTRYQEFLEHIEGKRVLYLLLGIGDNTPTIIRTPLCRMARANPRSFIASISLEDRGHALAGTAVEDDPDLAGRCLHLQADIDLVLDLLLKRQEQKR